MAINPSTGLEDPLYIDGSYSKPLVTAPTGDALVKQSTGLMSSSLPAQPIATSTTPLSPAPTNSNAPTPVYGAPLTQGWNVTDQQTVEGRIKGLIDSNSPLMQQAQTMGLQQANARGLANSSMAVGSSQDALYKAATPIATADANIQANAAQFNAIDPNKKLQLDSQVSMANADRASREGIAGADRTSVEGRLNTELASRERIAAIDNDTKIKLSSKDGEYKLLVANSQGAAGLFDTYQKAVNSINMSSVSAATKQQSIDIQFAILQAGMAMYKDMGTLNLDAILNPPGGDTGVGGTNPGAGSTDVALEQRQAEWDSKKAAIQQPVGYNELYWNPGVQHEVGQVNPNAQAEYTARMAAYQAAIAALGSRPVAPPPSGSATVGGVAPGTGTSTVALQQAQATWDALRLARENIIRSNNHGALPNSAVAAMLAEIGPRPT